MSLLLLLPATLLLLAVFLLPMLRSLWLSFQADSLLTGLVARPNGGANWHRLLLDARFLQDTLQTLRELRGANLPPAEARLKVKALVDRGQLPPDPGARRYREQGIEDNCALVAAVHNVTTPAQRQSAVRRLRAYQRDLADLSAAR